MHCRAFGLVCLQRCCAVAAAVCFQRHTSCFKRYRMLTGGTERVDILHLCIHFPGPPCLHAQANAELEQMLDPDLFESPAAAGGAAGKAGGNSSSSSGPSFSGGLVQDSVTILGMLAGVNALVQGALPLAVQVYACKTSGKPLPLSAKQDAELKEQEVAAALQEWDRANQLELRSFLLQVRQRREQSEHVEVGWNMFEMG